MAAPKPFTVDTVITEHARAWRFAAPTLLGTFAFLLSAPRANIRAQNAAGEVPAPVVGERIIMLQGLGAVHLAGTSGAPQTRVGINLVMPVQRMDGQRVWIVSTSGGDSGWVDRASIRVLSGAVGYFDTLIARDPRNWDAHLRRAEVEHALNMRGAATDDYSRAIELHPGEAFLYLRRGRHYNTLKECAKEIADFAQAGRLVPGSAHQDYNLVAELHSLASGVYFTCPDTTFRDYARGLALAKRAVAEDPSRATLVTILAAAYAQAGEYVNAAKTQREALARQDFPPGYRADAEQALARYMAAAGRRPD